jgi:flagellar biosynthesis/type III secretory pathway ATPase
VGAGKGRQVTVRAFTGKSSEGTIRLGESLLGIIIDARGRPLNLPADNPTRIRKLREWLSAMSLPLPS